MSAADSPTTIAGDASSSASGAGSAAEAARFPRLVGARTVTVVLLFIALELGLKYAGGLGWWTVNETNARYGWRMLPNQDARSRDLSVTERINSAGFRDREWSQPVSDGKGGWVKDESVFRVAVVGNSMTFGTSVPVEAIYTRVLEQRLQAKLDAAGSKRRALVMNFAVQGYCFEQMTRVYEDKIRPYRPDLLIVALHPHDVMPMAPSVDDPDYDLRTWVIRTATYDLLLRHVIDRWIPPAPVPPEAKRMAQECKAVDDSLTESPFSAANHRWFEQAATRMEQVRGEVNTDGGRLLLVFMPRWLHYFNPKMLPDDSFWGGWIRERPDVLAARPGPEFDKQMKPVIDEIAAKGMPGGSTFDLTTLHWKDAQGREHRGDELDTAAQSLHILSDMGHLTAKGHAVVADTLAKVIDDAGLVR